MGEDENRTAHEDSVSNPHAMADLTQTDVSRPSALPTANLLARPRAEAHAQAIAEQRSDEYLDGVEEEWNKKVDAEVDTLVDGMVDLVGLASVCSGYKHGYPGR